MNLRGPASPRIPVTLVDWEHTLTNALLAVHSENADQIRSFEITPETLASFCELGIEHKVETEKAFHSALVNDPHLIWCLHHGRRLPANADVPNCFAMLAFSLLVDSLLDGDYEDIGQYRAKLKQWLGIDRSFTNLSGIGFMWLDLANWLDSKVNSGAPFRRLVLPTIPERWTHIGFTRYLSFPTRRDFQFLSKQIQRNPKAANDPVFLVSILEPAIRSSPVSYGLIGAFDEFKTALRSGRASIDDRFWRLVGRVRKEVGKREIPPVNLRMEFDEDGARHFRIRASIESLPSDLGTAVASPTVTESPNLGPSIRRGLICFRCSGQSSWMAIGESPSGVGPFHIAIAERNERKLAGSISSFEHSGSWWVTKKPVAPNFVSNVLRRLNLEGAPESVRAIGLVDGVRVGNSWLGRPRFLPRIDGAVGEINVRRSNLEVAGTLSCVAGQLKADKPVEGEFSFSDPVSGWSRRAVFVSKAEAHSELEGASYMLPPVEEWLKSNAQVAVKIPVAELVWDESAYEYQDVLEALYASSNVDGA